MSGCGGAWDMAHYCCFKLPMQIFMCVSVCVHFSLLQLSAQTHTHTHTHWPLPLSAGWLPRLQCRLSSSCCYETRTDRPELNDNVSVALAGGPQEPIRGSLDKHFPNLGSRDLDSDCLGWQEHSQSYGKLVVNSVYFISSADVSFCTLWHAR